MDVPSQIPTQWIQRSQDHIVMTFNYRVNIFGSPNAPGLEDQNLGLLDQRAAVEWAKENIASFGGDPDRMVIWGQSAGSISVDYYSFQYPEDPIASGMSLDSGTVFSDITSKDKAQTNFTFVAENVGCGGFNESSSLLSCMRGVDGVKINDFIAAYTKSAQKPAISFGPVVDEKTVFSNYTERMLQGKQAKILSYRSFLICLVHNTNLTNSPPSSAPTPKTASPSHPTNRPDQTQPSPKPLSSQPSSARPPNPAAYANKPASPLTATNTPATGQTSPPNPGWALSTAQNSRCCSARTRTSGEASPQRLSTRLAM